MLACSSISQVMSIFIMMHITQHTVFALYLLCAASSPDDVIIVSQVELLGVFSGVVDHTHASHKVHQLFSSSVVQVVAALVTSVPVDPLQPQLTARRRLIRHVDLKLKNSMLKIHERKNRKTSWFKAGSSFVLCSSAETSATKNLSGMNTHTVVSVSIQSCC